jgi:hypothetical protein
MSALVADHRCEGRSIDLAPHAFTRRLMKKIFAAMTAALMMVALVSSSVMAAPAAQWKTFGDAVWVNQTGNPGWGLVTSSDASGTYGGIQLRNGPTSLASITAASFDFNANQTGASGGSPRLVFALSDGGNIQLRPLTWTANSWATEDGFGAGTNDWDTSGGSCGSLYGTTWATAAACAVGATITSIFLVNDSGWAYPTTGEVVVVDNITVNNIVATGPSKIK